MAIFVSKMCPHYSRGDLGVHSTRHRRFDPPINTSVASPQNRKVVYNLYPMVNGHSCLYSRGIIVAVMIYHHY